jgi:hypothetical protein
MKRLRDEQRRVLKALRQGAKERRGVCEPACGLMIALAAQTASFTCHLRSTASPTRSKLLRKSQKLD